MTFLYRNDPVDSKAIAFHTEETFWWQFHSSWSTPRWYFLSWLCHSEWTGGGRFHLNVLSNCSTWRDKFKLNPAHQFMSQCEEGLDESCSFPGYRRRPIIPQSLRADHQSQSIRGNGKDLRKARFETLENRLSHKAHNISRSYWWNEGDRKTRITSAVSRHATVIHSLSQPMGKSDSSMITCPLLPRNEDDVRSDAVHWWADYVNSSDLVTQSCRDRKSVHGSSKLKKQLESRR
jgi:hypothetical protein